MTARDIIDKIQDAIGRTNNDDDQPTIEIVTPQFEREDGKRPGDPPLTEEEFDALRRLPRSELKELGLRPFDPETGLWLLPADWYEHLPEGVTVRSISSPSEPEEFSRDTHGPDRRFGCLAYGIVPDTEAGE